MAEAMTESSALEGEDLPDLLADYEAPAVNAPKDIVAGRYRILFHQPLPQYSKTLATAYAVEDTENQNNDVYALVCVNTLPYRMKGIEALSDTIPSALPKCYAAAPTPLSNPAETRMVLVMEKPSGQKLSELIAVNGPFSDRVIIEKILRPLTEALVFLEKYKINHGCINPNTLYFGTQLKIGEPVSEPSGYSQDYFYEPPERLLADASGKGSGSTATDAYALAVLSLFLSLGKLPVQELSKEQLEERILKMGSYNAFAHDIDPNPVLADLLRGSLNDNPSERWDSEQVSAWLGGKRFNLILPSIPRDSSRPFHFNGEDYFNYRALAQGIYHHWEAAKTHLSAGKLVKWMELNATKAEAADVMSDVLGVSSDGSDDDYTFSDEEIMKVIAILDPFGPMRYKDAAVNIDGLGKAFAECFRDKNNLRRQHLITMMESGLPAFLANLIDRSGNSLVNNTLWRLQNLRTVLQLKGLGFGVERILYSLNPSMPCQSPLVMRFHPVTLADTLNTLDRIAKEVMKRASLIDIHLAAFLTSKLEITKEMRVLELAAHADLFVDQRLVMLKLLSHGQQKMGNVPLKGLAAWVAEMILPIAGKIHHKSNRELLIKEIRKAAATGVLDKIALLLFRDKLFSDDRFEHTRAKSLYRYYETSLVSYKDTTRIKKIAMLKGRSISVTVGYLVLGLGLYVAFGPYVRL